MIIDNDFINNVLKKSENKTKKDLQKILSKAKNLEGLNYNEVSSLLMNTDKNIDKEIFKVAGEIKKSIYGDRVVMFAPLYISNYCVNKCTYCGFKNDNEFKRKKLTQEEIKKEVEVLENMGHKRLALEAGEDPINCHIEYVLESLKTVYKMKFKNGSIRRVNVNIAGTTVENYKKLVKAEIGTYILFQETYHKESYEEVHIAGPKSNYEYHLNSFDRAMEAGIEDVGGGVLFGFYDYKFEVLSLMLHNEHLEKKYGVGFHTISVPRLCEAQGMNKSDYRYLLTDEEFIRVVAILRLAVPYTGIILSTRETQEIRKELINKGVSQISGGSNVVVGGYSDKNNKGNQFDVTDARENEDILEWVLEEDLIPSFCTACYRQGRTGDRFMELAKSGEIKNVCLPNGLLTLKEYGLDYSDKKLKAKINKLIDEKIEDIKNIEVKKTTQEYLKRLEVGERDLFL